MEFQQWNPRDFTHDKHRSVDDRQANLYFLRELSGRKARIKEKLAKKWKYFLYLFL
ncbi:50S ribosomal protein L19 [Colwellia sp. TT2012]|uniref:50S ribosomal protein L19 n=1 Tax=Colwellia sp. TT2012 TaxID=1720342 RepID=UPI0022B11498|nr:50S ribosomal protein L19 [Colwellia sp. TT2012]